MKEKEMMYRTRMKVAAVGALVLIVLLAGSSTPAQEVHSDAMPGVNFAKYHTYKWVPIEGGSHPNQIADAQIKASVDTQLATKGLTKTDSDHADLLIGYQVSVDQEKQWN